MECPWLPWQTASSASLSRHSSLAAPTRCPMLQSDAMKLFLARDAGAPDCPLHQTAHLGLGTTSHGSSSKPGLSPLGNQLLPLLNSKSTLIGVIIPFISAFHACTRVFMKSRRQNVSTLWAHPHDHHTSSTQPGCPEKCLLNEWRFSGPVDLDNLCDSTHTVCYNYFTFIPQPWELDPAASAGCLCREGMESSEFQTLALLLSNGALRQVPSFSFLWRMD